MIDDGQRGWNFEPFSSGDSKEEGGYYTFRVGGPLYAIVEPQGEKWHSYVCLEETDNVVTEIKPCSTLNVAKQVAIDLIRATLKVWKTQFEQMADIHHHVSYKEG